LYRLYCRLQLGDTINNSNHLYILPENTAVLTVGDQGLHLTSYELEKDKLTVDGHSVKIGYVDDEMNEQVFTGESLVLQLNQ